MPGRFSLPENPPSEPSFKPLAEFLRTVPWYGNLLTRYRAEPNIMLASVTDEVASRRLKFLYELFRFHNFKELINNNAKVYKNITSRKFMAILIFNI